MMNPADAPAKKPKRKRIKKRNTGENALKRFFPDNFIEMHRTQGVIFQVTDPDSAAVVARTWESVGRCPSNIVKLKRSVLQWQALPEPLCETLKDAHPEEFIAVGCCAVDAVLNRIDPACAFVVVRTKSSARGQWSIVAIYAPPPAAVITDEPTLSAEVMRVFLCDTVPKRVQHPLTSASSMGLGSVPPLPATAEDDESDDKSPVSLGAQNLLCETSSSQISPLEPGVPCCVVTATGCAQTESEFSLEAIESDPLQGASSSSCLTWHKRGSPSSRPTSMVSSPLVHNNMKFLHLDGSGPSGEFSGSTQQRQQHLPRTFSEQSVQSAVPTIECLVSDQVPVLERCESDGNVFKQSTGNPSQSQSCSMQGSSSKFLCPCASLNNSFQDQKSSSISVDVFCEVAEPPPSPFLFMPQEADAFGYVDLTPASLLSPCEPLPELSALVNRKYPSGSLSSTQPVLQQQQQHVQNFGFDKTPPFDPLMWQTHQDFCCESLHSSELCRSSNLQPSSELDFSHFRSRSMCIIPPNPLSPSFPPEAVPDKQTPISIPQEPFNSSEHSTSVQGAYSKYVRADPPSSGLSSPTAVPVPPPDSAHVGLHECYRIMAEKVWSASFGQHRTAPWPSFQVFVREGGGPPIDPILQPFFCLPSSPGLVQRSRWVMFVLLFHVSAWRDDPRPFLAVSEAIEWIKNWAFYGVLNRSGADAIMLNSVCEENGCIFRTSESSWGFLVLTRKNRTLQQSFWHTLFGHHRPGETVMVTTLGKHGSALDMNILEPAEVEKDFFYNPKNP